MLWLCLFICICIATQGILQPYIQYSADMLAMLLQLCLFLVVFGALNISSLDVPLVTADTAAKNIYNAKVQSLQTFIFMVQTGGYIIGGASLLYEAYFGRMFCELKLHNASVPPSEQLTKKEWFTIYNRKLKQEIIDMERKMADQAKKHVRIGRQNTKVLPSATTAAGKQTSKKLEQEQGELKNWGK